MFGVVNLVEADGSGITGTLHLYQPTSSQDVTIQGSVHNLPAGLHGFHVHTTGATGNNCKDAGGHFNPTNVSTLECKHKDIFQEYRQCPHKLTSKVRMPRILTH